MQNGSKESFQLTQPAYCLPLNEIARLLDTDFENGLSELEAKRRHALVHDNVVQETTGVSLWRVLVRQIANALTLVSHISARTDNRYWLLQWRYHLVPEISLKAESSRSLSHVFPLQSYTDSVNISIGFFQEYRAEKRMDALRQLLSPTGIVLRDSEMRSVHSSTIVPGDIVSMKTGDLVPADVRLFESMNFETDEALLTGESTPVTKSADVTYTEDIGVGDRLNMVYSGSMVTRGRAKGIVVATGPKTEIGGIAESIRAANKRKVRKLSDHRNEFNNVTIFERVKFVTLWLRDWMGIILCVTTGTPLQRKLSKLAYLLFLLAIVFALVVLSANKFNLTHQVCIYAISLGIAIIPESLIAVLSISMAMGTRAVAKRHVIVRKLDGLEDLGGVTNICSDKTGTLTQGKMVTSKVWIIKTGQLITVDTPVANDPTAGKVVVETGCVEFGPKIGTPKREEAPSKKTPTPSRFVDSDILEFVTPAALCNLATVRKDRNTNKWNATGDPTEIALQVFAERFGLGKARLMHEWAGKSEFPFDSAVKRMAVIYEHRQKGAWVFVKGAVERVLDVCTDVNIGNDCLPLNDQFKKHILTQMEKFASQGLVYPRFTGLMKRVLAIGHKQWRGPADRDTPRDLVERDITLLGLVGIYDPPREESLHAVRECHKAGIKVHMLTGDHPTTASAIAKSVGIIPENLAERAPEIAKTMVMTAVQFDNLTDAEIDNLQTLPLVIARCSPNTKVRMIDALHRRHACAAMTGDGVNDSPSLKKADIGIAMGMSGSDVAKDASEIVLMDDNFASIVSAIEEGRRIFDNICRFVLHLLCSNVGEVILLIIGLAFRDGNNVAVFPLAPLQILWINMITSSFPAIGLGMEKASRDVMKRKPHDPKRVHLTMLCL